MKIIKLGSFSDKIIGTNIQENKQKEIFRRVEVGGDKSFFSPT